MHILRLLHDANLRAVTARIAPIRPALVVGDVAAHEQKRTPLRTLARTAVSRRMSGGSTAQMKSDALRALGPITWHACRVRRSDPGKVLQTLAAFRTPACPARRSSRRQRPSAAVARVATAWRRSPKRGRRSGPETSRSRRGRRLGIDLHREGPRRLALDVTRPDRHRPSRGTSESRSRRRVAAISSLMHLLRLGEQPRHVGGLRVA